MKSGNKSTIFKVSLFTLALCGAGAFFFMPKEKEELKTMSAVINGKNEFNSVLEVKMENTNLSNSDFIYQWWYCDEDHSVRTHIDGATSSKYRIDDGLVGKYIGVTVNYKGATDDSTSYEDMTDKKFNSSTTVTAVDTEIKLDEFSGNYNGSVINGSVAKVNSDAEVIYTYYTDSLCLIETSTETGALVEGGAPVDAGNYYVKAKVLESANYKAYETGCIKHTIKPLDVSVAWSASPIIYNGFKQGPIASVVNGLVDENINLSTTSAVNVGEYVSEADCVSVDGGRGKCSNYNLISHSKKFNIDKKISEITINPKTEVYSGLPVFANNAETNSDGEVSYTYYLDSLCSKKTDTSVGAVIDGGAPIDAGYYYVQASVKETGNMSGAKSVCVPHVIEKKFVDVEWGNLNLTYSGDEKGPNAVADTEVNNEVIVLSRNTASLPGIYNVTASCLSVNGGRRSCYNYILNNNSNIFNISKVNANISLSSKSATYNGSVIGANNISTNSKGEVSYLYYKDNLCTVLTNVDDGAIVDGSAPIDAGNYYVRAFVGESSKYGASASGCVSHIIKPIDVTPTIINNSYVYDGSNKKLEYKIVYDKLDNEDVLFSSDEFIEPGEYNTNLYCTSVNGGRGECGNYNFVQKNNTLNIAKGFAKVTIDNFEKTFDNSFVDPFASVVGDGVVYFKYYTDSSCSKSISNPINAGNYYVKAFVDSTSRYTKAESSCKKYNINKFKSNVSWSDESFIYNGLEQGPHAYMSLYDGVLYEMSTSKAIDAGNYTSKAVCIEGDNSAVSCGNYEVDGLTKDYVINKASSNLNVSVLDVELRYPNYSIVDYTVDGDLKVLCSTDDYNVASCNIENNMLKISAVGEGSTKIKLYTEETDNYNAGSVDINVNVVYPTTTLNLYDGDKLIGSELIKYNETFTLYGLNTMLSRVFLGWSTEKDGEVVFEKDYIYTNSVFDDPIVNLYAVWSTYIYEDFTDSNTDIEISGDYSIDEENGNLIIPSKGKVVFTFSVNNDSNVSMKLSTLTGIKIGSVLESTYDRVFDNYNITEGSYTFHISNDNDEDITIDDFKVVSQYTSSNRLVDKITLNDLFQNIKYLLGDVWTSTVELFRKLFS